MDAVSYTEGFKKQMVKRMLGPPAVSASALSKQIGVPQPTLSKWLRHAGSLSPMVSGEKKGKGDKPGSKKWTVKEKLRVVVAAEGLEGAELTVFPLSRLTGLDSIIPRRRGWK